MSTMALINRGESNSERTRHIDIRHFWVKDQIDSGEFKVEYCPTKSMLADINTKPLQGYLFKEGRKKLLNME